MDTQVNAHHVLLACTAKKISLIKAYWSRVWGEEMGPLQRQLVSESWYTCTSVIWSLQWIHVNAHDFCTGLYCEESKLDQSILVGGRGPCRTRHARTLVPVSPFLLMLVVYCEESKLYL